LEDVERVMTFKASAELIHLLHPWLDQFVIFSSGLVQWVRSNN